MTPSSGDGDGGVDSRQLLLVSVCLVGLVTAAFLAPVTNENEPIGIDGSAVPADLVADFVEFLLGRAPDSVDAADGGDDGSGNPGPVPDWLVDLLDGLPLLEFGDTDAPERDDGPDGPESDDGGGGGIPDWLRDIADDLPGIDFGDDEGRAGGEPTPCQVYVGGNPRPGTETTVLVTVEGDPTSGVRVWFNDEYVGRTNDRGAVSGEVPYVEELEVTVESPTDRPCAFSREPSLGDPQPRPADAGQPAAVVGRSVGAAIGAGVAGAGMSSTGGAVRLGGDRTAAFVSLPDRSNQQATPGGANNSSRYRVAGDTSLRIEGEPYPNADVTLVATVRGVPMRDATVTVDGEAVGETDRAGRYRLSLPDRDGITVAVTRGEIRGQRRIDIWEVDLAFARKLVVPGETTTLNVTRDGAPVANATVTLAGQRLGTTGPDGSVTLDLPMRADGTVRAVTDAGDATVPLWRAYWLTGGLSLLLLGLSASTTWLTARRRDRATARRVALWWTRAAALFVGVAVWELRGLVGVGAVVLLVGLVRYRRAVAAGGATAAEQSASALDWCRRLVLRAVSGLEATVDWLRYQTGRLAAWLRSLPLSVSGLLGRLRARLRSLTAAALARFRGLSRRQVGAAALAFGLLLAATAALGARGFVLAALALLLVAVGWWLRRRRSGPDTTGGSAGTGAGSETSVASATGDDETPTLRRLWRRLAQRVTPADWRTRTPAEVSRRAVEKGFPRGPVETLTDAFRDVEYGGQSEESRREQARAAFDKLDRETDGEETER
ncbi:DUF4129 domain-containing protein [Haloarcula onubensis]|uniref:DUF4129 domain-containing protein n=1 Tax=Haloarcula onubensis TaxID=2950539 RepID=A0ABU2FSI5_9EURY|nr:DUF4129 domain-containing protein [Halomicroarcula sp. S3CR25-11]MDS0283211.1 DUF4129 domain-containing protein [Halomicroarcula sp. S3CR25-11]